MKTRPTYKKKWPSKNLGELVNFLYDRHPEGIRIKELAERLDTTPQNISWMFTRDDMKLSKAEAIAGAYGYALHLYFPLKEVLGMTASSAQRRSFPNAGNLSGMVQYIYDSNYSINFVSIQMGKSPELLTRAFNSGDMQISTMYRVIDTLGIYVIWEFQKIEDEET